MRYLRKETVFVTQYENSENGIIIIPDCMSRISSFGEREGCTAYITANDGSITITSDITQGIIKDSSGITISLNKRNVLEIPQNLLTKAKMENTVIAVLYLMDLTTVLMFSLETKGFEYKNHPAIAEDNPNEQMQEDVRTDLSRNTHSKSSDDFFHVENREEILKIRLSDIFYFEKVKGTHKTCVVFAGGISTFKSGLRDVLDRLDGGFVQCHKGFIANMTRVKRIEKQQGFYILHFDNNHSCPCSLYHKKAVMNWKY